jgi:hypothetical protein
MWERSQESLLEEMVAAGVDAVLIKVACMGLHERHLGKSLAQLQPQLLKLQAMYGINVCGEGGEYESLTLDFPLFKRRIVLYAVSTAAEASVLNVLWSPVTRPPWLLIPQTRLRQCCKSYFVTVASARVTRASLQVPKSSALASGRQAERHRALHTSYC